MKVKGKGQKGFKLCDCFLVVCGFWALVFVWFCYPRVVRMESFPFLCLRGLLLRSYLVPRTRWVSR